MLDLLEKSFLLGLGALSMTKTTAEKFIDEAIKQSKITPEEGKSLANTFEEEGSKGGASILPGYKSIKELEDKVAVLEAKVAALEGKAPESK